MNMTAFKQKEVTLKTGKKFTLQHPGVRNVTKITDRIKNKHGIPSDEKLADEMLTHVVVEPKVKIDDFDSYMEMTELVSKAFAFATDSEVEDEDDQSE